MLKNVNGFWEGRAVLVTGAGGYTGSALVKRLAAEGARVRAFVRRNGSRRPLPEGVEPFEGNLAVPADCERATRGIDTVFNVAAVFRRVGGGRSEMEAVHVGATESLLRAAKEAGCRRFVHTSTMGVHGHVEESPGDEESPYSPGDDYQETKLEGELLARRLAPELGVPLAVVRPCGIYGPGDTRFLKLVRPIDRGWFLMLGRGTIHMHLAYIDDLVDGFLLAGQKDEAVGEVFLVGEDRSIALRDLAKVIAGLLRVKAPRMRIPVWPVYAAGWLCELLCAPFGIEPPLHRRRVAFFTKNRSFRVDKARRELGYEPKVSAEEGFRRVIEWYRAENLL